MKKLTVCAFLAVFLLSAASAYNPPVNGENIFELSSPKYLTGASSVCGGALFSAGPDALVVNPALTAGEQRVVLNLADTFLWSKNDANSSKTGNALQLGLLVPTKLYIYSAYMNLTTVPFLEMNVGNSFNAKVGLAKEITDKLDVGLSIDGGAMWNPGADWSLGANLGFVYYWGYLSFMKDFRFGASVLNLGKNYNPLNQVGVKAASSTSAFPSIATLKLGCAASLFKNDVLNAAYSFDFTIPAFQNLIVDLGLQVSLKDMLVLSFAEKINLVEATQGAANYVPSVGLSFKFSFDVKDVEYLEKNDWSESEMRVSAAYKNMYKTVNAASAGVDLILGMQDTSAPVFDETIFEIEE